MTMMTMSVGIKQKKKIHNSPGTSPPPYYLHRPTQFRRMHDDVAGVVVGSGDGVAVITGGEVMRCGCDEGVPDAGGAVVLSLQPNLMVKLA